MTDNLYELLGVSANARPEVVKAAYQALAKLYHPDAGSSPDEQRMKQLNEAWETLRDPDRRARHDADLRRAAESAAHRAATDTNGAAEVDGPTKPTMGSSGWGEGSETPQPWYTPTPPPTGSPRASAQRPRSFVPRPTPPPPSVRAMPDPTGTVVDRRLGAAVVDIIVVVLVAVVSWLTFVVATYDSVGTIGPNGTPTSCTALRGAVRDCEEIDSTIYVSNETSSVIVEWLTWLVPILLIHVLLQAKTGATIGKLVFGVRTVRKDGSLPSLGQALIRTVLAVIDMLPWCFPLLGLCLVLTTRGHRRLGDMAAKTFVVAKSHVGQPIMLPSGRP